VIDAIWGNRPTVLEHSAFAVLYALAYERDEDALMDATNRAYQQGLSSR
jgi:predicted outer membrane lipoprotein